DGNIKYLGRVDQQVKIRGFRIELGEIETTLCEHISVKEAVVIASKNNDELRLIAYFVSSEPLKPSAYELREFLRDRLPIYMIPAVFIALDELPLTPNGKLDRRNLPPPEISASTVADEFVAPRTTAEEEVANFFTQVLNLKQVSINKNFFEIGGDSLLATRLVSQLRKSLRIDLPLRALFENPTVAQLAIVIEAMLIVQMEEITESEAAQLLNRKI
ncbi:MAG: phosphopantetheine-binding protein, partial [Acidobacteriota bacterium]